MFVGKVVRENFFAMGELAGEPAMKLLCSLPGIEHTLLSVLHTLNFHVSESRDRESRLHQRVDDLSAQASVRNFVPCRNPP